MLNGEGIIQSVTSIRLLCLELLFWTSSIIVLYLNHHILELSSSGEWDAGRKPTILGPE
jgi:hypothetical protein